MSKQHKHKRIQRFKQDIAGNPRIKSPNSDGATKKQKKSRQLDEYRKRPCEIEKLRQQWPVMLEAQNWEDYSLLDMGAGEKLERFGSLTIRRPEHQALGTRVLSKETWDSADAIFTGELEEEAAGRWKLKDKLAEKWNLQYGPAKFLGRFTSFRHVGVFPEQQSHWDWIISKINSSNRQVNLLNLFGYTGVASLLASAHGAKVTHVDASKKTLAWARENQELSQLTDKPIRWICDDAVKFTEREIRRQKTYDAVIFDPPKFGRGPNGEVWNLFADLPYMVGLVRKILSDQPLFVLLSTYSIRASFLSAHELMREELCSLPGLLESGELLIRDDAGGRVLSTSMFSRWSSK